MKLKFYSSDGSSSQEKDFAGIREFSGDKGLLTLKQMILAYQANKRQGNASTKLRSEVRGSGKKPFRQKGSGNARQGSKRSVIQRGGGVVHGPKPRNYRQKVNKKMKQIAFQRALFDRAVEGEIAVIERFEVAEAKSKLFQKVIQLIISKGKLLIVDDKWEEKTSLAARNLSQITLTEASTLNALDLCHYDKILVSEKGMETIIERTQKKPLTTTIVS